MDAATLDVAVVEAPRSGKPVVERLIQLYAYDFSEIMALETGEDGWLAGSRALATCWSEPWRHPYFVRAGGQLAGSSILDERSHLTAGAVEPSCDGARRSARRHRRR